MTRSDASAYAAAALAADYADELLIWTTRDVHAAVWDRLFGAPPGDGGRGGVVGGVHRGVCRAVYGGIGLGLKGAAAGLRAADHAGLGRDIEETPRGRFVVAAVNGLVGDRMREDGSPLSFDAGVRVNGRDVELTAPALREAFGDHQGRVGNRLVIFAHGLSESEAYWTRAARPRTEERRQEPERRSYGERLADEDGWVPVFLRINTGLPVAENGAAVSGLLGRLLENWPGEVSRIALVGHSMGGLLLRSACAVSTQENHPWTELVTDVVTLGTPHLGAPLERLAEKGTHLLGVVPEAAPLGRILEYRSVGILDLRHGLAEDVQNLPHARYRLVAATLTRSERSLMSATVGDWMVPFASATGRTPSGEEMFPGADILHVAGADHFDLLNHDRVYAALRGWLRNTSDPSVAERVERDHRACAT